MKKSISIFSAAVLCIFFTQKISKGVTTTGTIKIAIESLLKNNSTHFVSDTITIYLSNTLSPALKLDSAKSVLNSQTLTGLFYFNKNISNGNYYLIVRHRNSLLTWSKPVYITFGIGANFSYDFTISATQAFGNNLIYKYSKYCLFSGDINQDGTIDGGDGSIVENDVTHSLTGYTRSDLNGDNFVDVYDLSVTENNIENNVVIKIPALTYPVRDAVPNKSDVNKNVMLLSYTSVHYVNNVFSMYYVKDGITKLDTSLDGKNWKFKKNISVNPNGTPAAGDSMYSTIRRGNFWYSGWTCHSGSGATYTEWFNIAYSTNGYNYTQYHSNPFSFHPGEDLSFFDNTDSFYCYIRPNIPSIDPRRKVGLMKSRDFVNWTEIDTVIQFPDSAYFNPASQLYYKQPYNMNVIRIGNDWWGFMHVLRLEDDGTENWNYPYTGLEQTVETHLMYSINGKDWSFTNNKKAFLPLHDSVKQIYGLPTLVNDTLYVYSFENTLRHASYSAAYGGQPAVDFAKGKYWKIFRYKISVNDLNAWKP
ncbi:MAG TPA: hypothetical protein PKD83_02800 [Ignavibacteria bacterium]|nr:hypothetical protein [Ignavibacteria bacterium]